MSKRKAAAIGWGHKGKKASSAAASAAVTPQEKRIEVFMCVRLTGLVRVCLEHDDLERAIELAESFCGDPQENLELDRFERISSEYPGEGLDCAELVEITQDYRFVEPPEFYALKVDGKFVEGGDPDLLPTKYR
jgi:hypothetical protein